MKQKRFTRVMKYQAYLFIGVFLLAGCVKPLRHDSTIKDVRDTINSPEYNMPANNDNASFDYPIDSLPDDSFWVKPTFNTGALPDKNISNLSVTDRGLYDVLKMIFSDTNVPITFEGGPSSLSKYGPVSASNLSGSLTKVMNQLSEMLGFFWTLTESGVLRISPDQQFVIEMPPVLSEDNMAGFTNTIQYLGGRDVFLDRINRTLVFRANRRSLESIRSYMEESRRTRSLIVYDMNVFQVDLNDRNSTGIQWDSIREGRGLSTAGTGSPGLAGIEAVNSDNQFNTIIYGRNFQISALLSFLRRQGDVQTLSQPKIGLMNGTQGSIRVGQQTTFVSRVGTQFVNGVSQSQADTEEFETGLEISVSGEVHDSTVYSRINISIRELLALTDFVAEGVELRLPEIADRILSTQVRSRPGDTVLLGGMTVARAQDASTKSITANTRSEETSLTELVITLRPTVLRFVQDQDRVKEEPPIAELKDDEQKSTETQEQVDEKAQMLPSEEGDEKAQMLPSEEESYGFHEDPTKREFVGVQNEVDPLDVDENATLSQNKNKLPRVEDLPNNLDAGSMPEEIVQKPETASMQEDTVQQSNSTDEVAVNEQFAMPKQESGTMFGNANEPPVAVSLPVITMVPVEKITVAPPSLHALAVPMSNDNLMAKSAVAENDFVLASPKNEALSTKEPLPQMVSNEVFEDDSATNTSDPNLELLLLEPKPVATDVSKKNMAKSENTAGSQASRGAVELVSNLENEPKKFYGDLIPEPDWEAKLKAFVLSRNTNSKKVGQDKKTESRTGPSDDLQIVPDPDYGSLLSKPMVVSIEPSPR